MANTMLAETNQTIFQEYIDSWLNKDIATFLTLLSTDVFISECYGATYLGKTESKEWFEHWNASEANQVLDWTILSHYFDNTKQISFFEWSFSYKYKNETARFNGMTLLQTSVGKITTLKEYKTEAETYRPYEKLS